MIPELRFLLHHSASHISSSWRLFVIWKPDFFWELPNKVEKQPAAVVGSTDAAGLNSNPAIYYQADLG